MLSIMILLGYYLILSVCSGTLQPLITLNKSKPYTPELPKVNKKPQGKKCYVQFFNKRIGLINLSSFFNNTDVLIKELVYLQHTGFRSYIRIQVRKGS